MSTGESLALMALGALAGAGARQPGIDRQKAKEREDAETIAWLTLALQQANETITAVGRENAQLRREKTDILAENARLRELVPPEELEGS
ncbi:MAG: hypothetical protein IIA92_12380 [Chloroflexi bacterium]|nr:hypothetical protein [Chloroflexota bacterium]